VVDPRTQGRLGPWNTSGRNAPVRWPDTARFNSGPAALPAVGAAGDRRSGEVDRPSGLPPRSPGCRPGPVRGSAIRTDSPARFLKGLPAATPTGRPGARSLALCCRRTDDAVRRRAGKRPDVRMSTGSRSAPYMHPRRAGAAATTLS